MDKNTVSQAKQPQLELCLLCEKPRGEYRVYCKNCGSFIRKLQKALKILDIKSTKNDSVGETIKTLIRDVDLMSKQIDSAYSKINELSERLDTIEDKRTGKVTNDDY